MCLQGVTGTAGAGPLSDDEEDEDEEVEGVRVITLPLQAHHAMEKMEEFVHKVSPAMYRAFVCVWKPW